MGYVRRLAMISALAGACLVGCSRQEPSADREVEGIFEAYDAVVQPRDQRWPDVSKQTRLASRQALEDLQGRIDRLDDRDLPAEQRLSLDIVRWDLARRLQNEPFDTYMGPVGPSAGWHNAVVDALASYSAQTVEDYEDLLLWIGDVPKLIDQVIEVLSEGLQAGYSQSHRTTQLVLDQLRGQMDDVDTTPVLNAFRSFPSSIPEAEQQRLRDTARRAYETQFIPSWQKLYEFMNSTYLPQAPDRAGLSAVPNGAETYLALVRASTTTSMTPEEIHDLGVREVERIEGEMLDIVAKSGFKGTLEEYDAQQLATPGKVFSTREEMLAFARNVAKLVEPELPRLFHQLPRIPFGIEAVAEAREATASNRYSLRGSGDRRAGRVSLRTYQPETYTRGETRSVALHEGVPGHHLQRALQAEMEGVPAFRRSFGTTAFVEGWALYAESLVDDLGIFQDPDSQYGRLSGQRFRSARLVVDTGLHAMGWTREQALDYFMLHAPRARWVEIDRYLERPAQALGYKVGELTFQELRRYAEQELGPKFDLRDFHEAVLKNGPLPFDLLRQQVDAYVSSTREATSVDPE